MEEGYRMLNVIYMLRLQNEAWVSFDLASATWVVSRSIWLSNGEQNLLNQFRYRDEQIRDAIQPMNQWLWKIDSSHMAKMARRR